MRNEMMIITHACVFSIPHKSYYYTNRSYYRTMVNFKDSQTY